MLTWLSSQLNDVELGHQLAVDDALHGESDHQGGGVVARHLQASDVDRVRYFADESRAVVQHRHQPTFTLAKAAA